jgi:hypothetical protein
MQDLDESPSADSFLFQRVDFVHVLCGQHRFLPAEN